MRSAFVPIGVATLTLLAVAASSDAQPLDAVGIRAQGMAGAFTAVADDATATWWNPAGLASGAYFNAIVEYGSLNDSGIANTGNVDHHPDHWGLAVAFPALGLSYYRTTVFDMQPRASTAGPSANRQDLGTPGVRAVDLSQFGVTVGQSIGAHFVVASTLKLARAEGDTQAGLDLGVMAALNRLRLGVSLRNLREPTFGEGDAALTLRRQVRGGAALTVPGRGSFGGVTLALDGDVLTVATATGDERRLAGGGEVWLWNRLLGARAGISASTVGDARTAGSAGATLKVYRALYADGQLTRGSDVTRHGWGAALRVTF